MGGDMVRAVLARGRSFRAAEGGSRHARQYLRAEPVAALYEQGKAKHVGRFRCWKTRCAISASMGFVRPLADRLDALVWAVTALTTRRGRAADTCAIMRTDGRLTLRCSGCRIGGIAIS